MNCIHDNAQLIRLPWNKVVSIAKYNKIAEEFLNDTGQTLTLDDLKYILSEDEAKKVSSDMNYKVSIVDLDMPRTDNNKNLTEIIGSVESPQKPSEDEIGSEIDHMLAEFTPREKEIIKMYHGIGYSRTYTLKEIGIDLGLTRERIRQIKEKVLEKIKKKKTAETLKGLINDQHKVCRNKRTIRQMYR